MEKNYVFRHPIKRIHYTAPVTVLCVDDNFLETFELFRKKYLKLEHVDRKLPAGGARVFLTEEKRAVREHYFDEIQTSISLHQSTGVLLFGHQDCGYWKKITTFQNHDEEFEFHVKKLREAKTNILLRFPNLSVETYFVDTEGVAKID